MSINIIYKQGGGSEEIHLVQKMQVPHYGVIKRSAIRYLKANWEAPGTIEMLEQLPFELWQSRNDFGDDFEVLYMKAGMSTYVEIENEVGIWRQRIVDGCPAIARALERVGHPVRFIAVELDLDEGVADMAPPALTITSDVVEEALRHAETLTRNHGAASGLDRVHTAFQAYLESACENAGIVVKPDAGITELFGRLREQHPALAIPDLEDKARIDQIIRGMARTCFKTGYNGLN